MKTHGTTIQRRGSLLAILACATFFASGWAAEPLRVRVLTYNIHHGEGTDGNIDLARIASVIKRLKPDVVALQEVDKKTTRSNGVDQAAELGKLTEMHVAFGKAMDFAGGQYGEAILSRYPLQKFQIHALPFTEGCEPRCVLAARFRLGEAGPEIVFASTHLEHAKAPVRLCQAQKLNPILAAANALPTILAGDFNEVPDSPAIKVLQSHWTDATAGRPQPTWPADQPRTKIDYVFFRPADGWRVVEQQVIGEPVASDHRPLLVVLECLPSWLAFVPEMERLADLDGSLREHWRDMEQAASFDGVMFRVEAQDDQGARLSSESIWDANSWKRDWLKPALADLQTCRFERFKDNFVRFNATPGNLGVYRLNLEMVTR